MARELAKYFFPSADDEIVKQHEETWAKFSEGKQHDSELNIDSTDKGIFHLFVYKLVFKYTI